MNEETEKYDYDLLVKYLLGESTAEEKKQVEAWLSESPENEKLLAELKQAVNLTNFSVEPANVNTNKAWGKLKSRMDAGHEAKIIRMDTSAEKSNIRSIKNYYGIAAAIIGVLLVAALVFRFLPETPSPPFSEIATFSEKRTDTLPDNSRITLNVNSNVKFASSFSENERRVALTGEAFFDVVKNPEQPFIIETGGLEIKVLGTSFNVQAYPKSETVEVIVESGSVQLKSLTEQDSITLTPGTKGVFSKRTSKLSKSENDDVAYGFWRAKKIEFRNTSLKRVVETLNNYYNAGLSLQNESIGSCLLTASFQNDSLSDILEIVTTTFELEIEQDSSGKMLTGAGCSNETL